MKDGIGTERSSSEKHTNIYVERNRMRKYIWETKTQMVA
jgi:hypothetical protein